MAVKNKSLKKEEKQEGQQQVIPSEEKVQDDVTIEEGGIEIEIDKTPLPDDVPETVDIEKKVRVRFKKNISFYFGGENYTFAAGKTYTIPKDVKLHLNKFDVLMPL